MPDLDIDSLTAPLASDGPCGANLEYDPAFDAMEKASLPRPETQYGDKITPAQPPDWPAVRQHALALAARTRDLRVAVQLVRSGARVEGFESAARGLQLVCGLLQSHWAHVHPTLDASDHNDPTARVSALVPLAHAEGLADLRAAGLTPVRGSVTVRDIELAFGRAEALPGESVPTESGITPAVAAAMAQRPQLAAAMTHAVEAAQASARLLDDKLGAGVGPDLSPLIKLLQAVALAAQAAQGHALATSGATGNATGNAPSAAPKPAGAIDSREDAIRTLQRVSEWIERNEPSNPAPLLIQRAQRLMKKTNFLDIIKDLMPDGLGQIEKLAGPGRE